MFPLNAEIALKTIFLYLRRKRMVNTPLRGPKLLLGHTKLESTVRYLGIEAVDALEMAEQTEV